jgi:hypothetical protein
MATWKDSFAETTVSTLGKMRHREGDQDVFTKSGRNTNVTLQVKDLRISDDGEAWIADVYYKVREARRDNTTFDFTTSARLPIPKDAVKGQSFITNVREYTREWQIRGQRHDVMDVPYTEGTVLAPGSTYRIDGKGDDQGTIFAELMLKLPFKYLDSAP